LYFAIPPIFAVSELFQDTLPPFEDGEIDGAEQPPKELQQQQRTQHQHELELVHAQERASAQQIQKASQRAEVAFHQGIQEGLRLAESAQARAAQLAGIFKGGRKPTRRGGGKKRNPEGCSSGVGA